MKEKDLNKTKWDQGMGKAGIKRGLWKRSKGEKLEKKEE